MAKSLISNSRGLGEKFVASNCSTRGESRMIPRIRRIKAILRSLSSASRNNNYRKYFPDSLECRSSASIDSIRTQDFVPSPSPSTRDRERRLSRINPLDDLTPRGAEVIDLPHRSRGCHGYYTGACENA